MPARKNKKQIKLEPGINGRKRLLLFRIISGSIPILLVILIEVALRIAGYGDDYKLFVECPENESYWVMSDFASR